ncbi:hypothetical protein PG996_006557 [Apiospora saccharicola]|uniref:2EXR domain-containing protein n=1 Tax=Apiospora saccharicola TaxID=335842 RepID=A0ABR1VB18_9PEZI
MAENHHIFTTPSPLSQTTLIASMPVEAPSYKAADKSTSADPTDDEPCNFNKLPPELRTEIWKLAASSDNNVLMISDRKEATVTIPPPVSAWVCQESRAIAFQYGHVYRVGDKWTWFSPEFDRVALDAEWTSRRWHRGVPRELKVIGESLVNDVRHVLASPGITRVMRGSSVDSWSAIWMSTLYPSIEVFPNLQSIGVIREAFMISGSSWKWKWNYYSLFESLNNDSYYPTTLIYKIDTESQIMDEIAESSFARSYPRDWMGNTQSVKRTETNSLDPCRSRRAWEEEKRNIHRIWNTWFHQHLAMTPTTLSRPVSYGAWNSDKLPWMNQVKDRAPFIYPTILVVHGKRRLKVADHPAFTEDELRELQRHAMQAFLVETFGDEALPDANADEEAAT